MEKILITGTGRCGTTFLIKLFSFLEFDTGFDKSNYSKYIYENCNSGMEKKYTDDHYIIKSPTFLSKIENIINDSTVKIKTVIIPIRNLKSSAASRVKNEKKCGGLWNAVDEKTQIDFYKDILINYICVMTKYDINTIFIDFDKMISNKKYLFDKLKCILDEKNIDFDLFCKVYEEVELTSKPVRL